MLDVLLLLSVPRWLLEGFDDKRRRGWDYRYGSLTILYGEPNCDSQPFLSRKIILEKSIDQAFGIWSAAYPITCGLRNIFSDLFRGETQRTNLWSESGRSSHFTTGRPQVAVRSQWKLLPMRFCRLRSCTEARNSVLGNIHDFDLIWIELWSFEMSACSFRVV